jgi:hypothetical protein
MQERAEAYVAAHPEALNSTDPAVMFIVSLATTTEFGSPAENVAAAFARAPSTGAVTYGLETLFLYPQGPNTPRDAPTPALPGTVVYEEA